MPRSRLTDDHALAVTLGANIFDARHSAGVTQSDLATAAGISESMLSKMENGKAIPGVLVLASLARALGVQPGVLFETVEEQVAA